MGHSKELLLPDRNSCLHISRERLAFPLDSPRTTLRLRRVPHMPIMATESLLDIDRHGLDRFTFTPSVSHEHPLWLRPEATCSHHADEQLRCCRTDQTESVGIDGTDVIVQMFATRTEVSHKSMNSNFRPCKQINSKYEMPDYG